MRAVNLIPADQQRGAGGAAGRSAGGAYLLLGALALLVVMAGAAVQSGKSVDEKKSELARVTQQATEAEANAQSLQSYTKFSSVRTKRVDTVSQLAASRFDWAHSLREVARVLPTNAWLTALTGTTSPTVSVGGGSSSLRGALSVPAIQIEGCTTSQASVAKMMARLRLIDGVQRVSLEDSTKAAKVAGAAAGAGAASGGSADCRGGSSHFPLFKIVVFYEQPAAPVPVTGGTTQTAAATGTASSTTPAASSASTTPSTTTPAASGGVTP
ncbi:MAG TPA: PilN domain-containing protein [Baekduia sp.]|uniref:PilN domain-containing protein n=1 Tax=Baekduia sp. TaxID=2600305 RepID=UPI002BB016F3|nr:PilN domain-containing protein [Baekduia sp.]HMJ32723.1 PilN domain-containing protein [Baekduia sp.]